MRGGKGRQRDGESEEGTKAEWTGKYEKVKTRVARSCQRGYCTDLLKNRRHGKREAGAKDEPFS